MMKFLLAPLVAMSLAHSAPAKAADAASGLTGQTAIYALSLYKVRTPDVTGAVGQMRFAITDGCTGWGTTQHMTLLIRNADGTLTKTVSDYVTWESKDSKTLTFSLSEQDNDGKTVIDDAGTATHSGADGRGLIVYSTPANTRLTMPPGTLFPMAHTARLLEAGRDGDKYVSVPLFDGTAADGAQATFIAVLGHHKPGPAPYPALAALPSTDVDIAFYDRTNDDENPDFRSQMRYFENGVTTNMLLDFGDFTMQAKLSSLQIPVSACK